MLVVLIVLEEVVDIIVDETSSEIAENFVVVWIFLLKSIN